MTKRPISTVVIIVGQSNCSPYFQTLVCRILSAKYRCLGDRRGGTNVTAYIGDAAPYARTATYNHLRAKLAGISAQRLVIVSAWGETAADNSTTAAAYRAHMDVFYGFLMEDFGATQRLLVQTLPYDSDSGGYGSGGTGDTVVNGLLARATDEAPYTVSVPTSDLPRTDTVHIDAGSVPTFAARVLAAVDTVLAA